MTLKHFLPRSVETNDASRSVRRYAFASLDPIFALTGPSLRSSGPSLYGRQPTMSLATVQKL